MCGIVGYVGGRSAKEVLLEGLKRLEYRGYDSAGVAVLSDGRIGLVKEAGKVSELEGLLRRSNLDGSLGIGHTRWATHGVPNQVNAHPHLDETGRFAVVHNGIVENYAEIKRELAREGVRFASDTDTEVIVQLVSRLYGGDLLEAVRSALLRLRGAFAVAVISDMHPGELVVARKGSPLVLGLGEGENFCASDVTALLPYTRRVIFLEEEEMALLRRDGVWVFGFDGTPRSREEHQVHWDLSMAERGGYEHYMLKEINEQGYVVRATCEGRLSAEGVSLELPWTSDFARSISEVHLVACGTSYYASLVGERALERWTTLPVRTDIASEFRYRRVHFRPGSLVVLVSQSGETADTIGAARMARAAGARTMVLTNVVGSTLYRECEDKLLLRAGPEIGVAATKTFMGQITLLYLLAVYLGKLRGELGAEEERAFCEEMLRMPYRVELVLEREGEVRALAEKYHLFSNFLYLGRGFSFPVAMEGALKLKEISYVHAEAYAAGEMKHGPIALIDERMPVMVVIPRDSNFEKTLSNVQETKARRARVIAVATDGDEEVTHHVEDVLRVPPCAEELTPMLTVVPLQLFAYHVAKLRCCEIDKPRNLAKSVTVE